MNGETHTAKVINTYKYGQGSFSEFGASKAMKLEMNAMIENTKAP
jgi:hypothetical protein